MQTKHPTLEQVLDLLKVCDLPTEDVANLDLSLFLAIEQENQLAGIIGLEMHGSSGLLRSLAVTPTHRNSGSGQKLVRDIEALARSLGLSTLYLLTTTAEVFFERLGYQHIARHLVSPEIQATSEFASICPDSAAVMGKKLTGIQH
ncbi:MAG: arsenic resistance N-acetyltransferase ArsN2 [Pseudomonadales bacterium]